MIVLQRGGLPCPWTVSCAIRTPWWGSTRRHTWWLRRYTALFFR